MKIIITTDDGNELGRYDGLVRADAENIQRLLQLINWIADTMRAARVPQ